MSNSYYKFYIISCLSISYPNRISMVIGLASTRNYDATILIWSGIDNILYDSCDTNNLPNYSLYANKNFLGILLYIPIPHRHVVPFQLKKIQIKDNLTMSKIRVRVEWAYSMIKMYWKLTIKFLYFKLD